MSKPNSQANNMPSTEGKSKKSRETVIGNFIRKSRKARRLTQRQLAEYSGVSFTFLNRVENGDLDVKMSTINKVLAVFNHQVGPVPITEDKPDEQS